MGRMNIADLLRDTSGRMAQKVALVEVGGRALDYGALDAEVDRVAAGLQQRGVAPGDRVAIALPNVLEFVTAYLGALRAGAVAVPLNITLKPQEVARIVADAKPTLVVVTPDTAASFAGTDAPELVSTDRWEELAPPGAHPDEPSIGPDDLAVLAYTSGTTGAPKGAMLSHGNLRANLDQQMAIPTDTITQDDVLFLTLPLFHIFGLNVPLGLLLLNGASGILLDRFEPVEALRLIEQHRVTVLFGAPPMYVAWVNTPGADQYDVSSVRLAISGAAALAKETLKGFEAIFGVAIYEGYGLTETAPTLTTNRMADEARAGSIGKELPGVELRLVNEHFADVELGDPGEIIVRGPNVFQGYWNREEESAEVFHDGWFRTGDVAVRDEEGYLYLVDRKRDLIIVSGFNVFPSEVEEALLTNDKIVQAAAVGEPHPYTGETVKAFVVLEEGATATEEELQEHAAERLARFKCPTSIEIVDSLPQMPTGKVLRRALRA
jgi:long-chain acyl-CoA synthetase